MLPCLAVVVAALVPQPSSPKQQSAGTFDPLQLNRCRAPPTGRLAAAALAAAPFSALADMETGEYMSASDEKLQTGILVAITAVVLVAPTFGIISARNAIDAMADDDDMRFRGVSGAERAQMTPAQRSAKQKREAALKAQLLAETEAKKKKGWFG